MRKVIAGVVVVGLAIGMWACTKPPAADPKPGKPGEPEKKVEAYTLGQVMAQGMKSGLWQKVADGKATKEEQQKFEDMVTAMVKMKPPKGDVGDWTLKTTELVAATQAARAGKEGAGEQLKKAADCKACHEAHR